MRIFFIVLLWMWAASAWAHGIHCQAMFEPQERRVRVDAYYDGNRPAANARVWMTDAADKEIAFEETNKAGICYLPAPPPGSYVLHVDAGAGHLAQAEIRIPDDFTGGIISRGKTRADATGTPWMSLAMGLTCIGALGTAAWKCRRWIATPVETSIE